MPMSIDEFRTMKVTMARTTAADDTVALGAIREVNALLTRHRLTWDEVLNQVIKIELPFEDDPDRPAHDDELEALFDAAQVNARGSFRELIESIYDQWQTNGSISTRQREIVENTARGRP